MASFLCLYHHLVEVDRTLLDDEIEQIVPVDLPDVEEPLRYGSMTEFDGEKKRFPS